LGRGQWGGGNVTSSTRERKGGGCEMEKRERKKGGWLGSESASETLASRGG
jgi:hypothetical protein